MKYDLSNTGNIRYKMIFTVNWKTAKLTGNLLMIKLRLHI